jgi:carbon storage regulator
MLVLSREKNESIMIGTNIKIIVAEIRGNKVRLAIDAPQDVRIHRQEIYDKIQQESSDDNHRH